MIGPSHPERAIRHQNVPMDLNDFEAERQRLAAIAGRILGSHSEVDDVLQEARLRLARTDDVINVPGWLTTVVTRLCLDQLRKRRTRSEFEADAPTDQAPVDPETDALIAERVGGAMQIVLDTLAPAERAAFILHDVFGYSFEEISAILGRSDNAVRQLASRARRKMQGSPEPVAEAALRAQNRHVVDAFLLAARGGDLATLLSLLAPDAVMRADLVGQHMGTPPVFDGAAAVAARFNGSKGAVPVVIDGELGAAWIAAGVVKVAFVFHIDAGMVREIELIADPDVLATMDVTRRRSRKARVNGDRNPNERE
jgi:RNA polymerase sigma factor (sigma-70 family)